MTETAGYLADSQAILVQISKCQLRFVKTHVVATLALADELLGYVSPTPPDLQLIEGDNTGHMAVLKQNSSCRAFWRYTVLVPSTFSIPTSMLACHKPGTKLQCKSYDFAGLKAPWD